MITILNNIIIITNSSTHYTSVAVVVNVPRRLIKNRNLHHHQIVNLDCKH